MTSLWFVIPADGRYDLTRVCLTQMRRTCDTLHDLGVDAHAVVIADDGNLDTAADLGHGTICRENKPLGRKWNDGFQLAGMEGVDYVVPFGSDDWVDPHLIAEQLPNQDTVRCFNRTCIVNEDCSRLARLNISYPGGDGVKIIPTAMLHKVGYRPAQEDRHRAIDTSIMQRLRRHHGGSFRLQYAHDNNPLQLVDWKSHRQQLNSYKATVGSRYVESETQDVWGELAAIYPAESLQEMQALHMAVAA